MALLSRFTRFLIFAGGLAVGYGVSQFAHSNSSLIDVSLPPYSLRAPVYLLALVPLAAGLAAGWLYTVPARAAEFTGHWRSWRQLRRMERENHRLQHNLDQVLDLPDAAAPLVASTDREASAAPVAARVEGAPAGPAGGRHRGRAARAVLSQPAAPAN